MKRILFVVHDSSISGSSNCFLNLLKALDKTYYEPIVLIPKEGSLCSEIIKLDVHIEYLPSLATYPYNRNLITYKSIKSIINIHKSFRGFCDILKKLKPEIVYFNTMMLFPYLKIAKLQDCKTIIHIREHWPINEHTVQLGWARKAVDNYSDRVVAINHYSASIFPDKESTIVYDWIDMDSRRNGPSLNDIMGEDCSSLKVYLYTGGVRQEKGAIEIIRTFSEHIVGKDRRLLMLGINKEINRTGLKGKIKILLSKLGYKTYLEKVISLCNKDNRIICHPAIFGITNIMEQIYGSISFFTIPHANLSLAESIIMQVPSVAAMTEESLEYSNNGMFAKLYEICNMESFKNAWLELDSNQTKLQEKLAAGSIMIADLFNPKRNAEVFNKMLCSL